MEQLLSVDLDNLIPDPDQPRKDFDPEALQDLADSIKAVGVKTPISIRPNPSSTNSSRPQYMIIAGERRWRASQISQMGTIPAVLTTDQAQLTTDSLFAHQLTENLHRQDLNPVEKAEFINGRVEYLKSNGVSNAVEEVSKELGVSPSWISKNTAILKYEPDLRALARDGLIRDYTVLKKISKLRADRKLAAIEQIKGGDFNSKEFFGRKRISLAKSEAEGGEELDDQIEGEGAAPKATPTFIGLQMTQADWVKVIEKTSYTHMLERTDQNWQAATDNAFKEYLKAFKKWSLET